MIPLVPEKCMICGAPYMGGCALPGTRFKAKGLRVFFRCGASISVIDREKELGMPESIEDYCYFLRMKNCNSRNSDWEYEKQQQIAEGILDANGNYPREPDNVCSPDLLVHSPVGNLVSETKVSGGSDG